MPSVSEMKRELEEKGVNLQNTSLTGQDLDRLTSSDEEIPVSERTHKSAATQSNVIAAVTAENETDQTRYADARSDAERQRLAANKNAVIPSFKVGQRVLLYDPTNKVHEAAKLKIRYKGPYEILKEVPKFKYILLDLITQKEIKRPVHADRLRPFLELSEKLRVKGWVTDVCLASVFTKQRKIAVKTNITDITMSECEVIICMLTTQMGMSSGAARDIIRCAEQSVTEACCQYIDAAEFETPLKTEATGLREQIKFILHIVIGDIKDPNGEITMIDEETLRRRLVSCLQMADELGVKSIAIPFPDVRKETIDKWSICQNLAQAIVEFDQKSTQHIGQLEVIEFVCLALSVADCLCVVTKQLFAAQETAQEMEQTAENLQQQEVQQVDDKQAEKPETPQSAEALTQQSSTEWYPVEKLLKRQIRNGKEYYLVKWQNGDEPTWEERQNVTDALVKAFFAEERKRAKRRRR